jgi:hypothetical protein
MREPSDNVVRGAYFYILQRRLVLPDLHNSRISATRLFRNSEIRTSTKGTCTQRGHSHLQKLAEIPHTFINVKQLQLIIVQDLEALRTLIYTYIENQ